MLQLINHFRFATVAFIAAITISCSDFSPTESTKDFKNNDTLDTIVDALDSLETLILAGDSLVTKYNVYIGDSVIIDFGEKDKNGKMISIDSIPKKTGMTLSAQDNHTVVYKPTAVTGKTDTVTIIIANTSRQKRSVTLFLTGLKRPPIEYGDFVPLAKGTEWVYFDTSFSGVTSNQGNATTKLVTLTILDSGDSSAVYRKITETKEYRLYLDSIKHSDLQSTAIDTIIDTCFTVGNTVTNLPYVGDSHYFPADDGYNKYNVTDVKVFGLNCTSLSFHKTGFGLTYVTNIGMTWSYSQGMSGAMSTYYHTKKLLEFTPGE